MSSCPLAFDGTPPTIGTVAASNSVTPPPSVVAVDRDGTRAYDLSDAAHPRLVFTGRAGYMPQAVSLHPDGRLLAVAGADVFSIAGPDARASLCLLPIGADGFGEAAVLEPVDEDRTPIVPSYMEWHPDGSVVAACFPWRDEVRLYAANGGWLEPLGPPVGTGKFPFAGHFTPDGNWFITTDVQWGHDVEDVFGNPADGRLSVLRLDPRAAARRSARRPWAAAPKDSPSARTGGLCSRRTCG